MAARSTTPPPHKRRGVPTAPRKPPTLHPSWRTRITEDLEWYHIEHLKEALSVYTPIIEPLDKKEIIEALIEQIKLGARPRLLPPLNYVRHYTVKELEALSDEELTVLLLKMGCYTFPNVVFISREEMLQVITITEMVIDYDELHAMNSVQYHKFYHDNISRHKLDPSISDYVAYLDALDIKVQSLNCIPDKISLGNFSYAMLKTNHGIPLDEKVKVQEEGKSYTELCNLAVRYIALGTAPFTQVRSLREELTPVLTCSHGRVAASIKNHGFYINEGNFICTYAFEYLMDETYDFVQSVLREIIGANIHTTHENLLQILWMIYISKDPILMDVSLLRDVSIAEMRRALPTSIKREIPDDDASIIWWWLTNTFPPSNRVVGIPNYEKTLKRHGNVVMSCCKYIYNYFDEVLPLLNPYRFLALIDKPSPFEKVIEALHGRDVVEVNKALGNFVIFPPVVELSTVPGIKRSYFLRNLNYYAKALLGRCVHSTSLVHEIDSCNITKEILIGFTDAEIIRSFHCEGMSWSSRPNLIDQVYKAYTNYLRNFDAWSFLSCKTTCLNSKINSLTLTERSFDDPKDPIVSLGDLYRGYRYNISELIAAFSPGLDGITRFYNPGYDEKNTEDDIGKEFSIDSIKDLLRLLKEDFHHSRCLFDELVGCIEKGLHDASKIVSYSRDTRMAYESLSDSQKISIEHLIMMTFSMSMYARFWKGPGHQYQYVWVENGAGEDEKHPTLTTMWERDHLFFEEYKKFELYPEADLKFFSSFMITNHVWSTGTTYLTDVPLLKIIKDAARSSMCLADLSDRGLQTSYHLMSKILGWSEREINERLRLFFHNTEQEYFNPTAVGSTAHVDPELKIKILES